MQHVNFSTEPWLMWNGACSSLPHPSFP